MSVRPSTPAQPSIAEAHDLAVVDPSGPGCVPRPRTCCAPAEQLTSFIVRGTDPEPCRAWRRPSPTGSRRGSGIRPCRPARRPRLPRGDDRGPGHRTSVSGAVGAVMNRDPATLSMKAGPLLQGLPRHSGLPLLATLAWRRGRRILRSIFRAVLSEFSRATSTRRRGSGAGSSSTTRPALWSARTAVIEDESRSPERHAWRHGQAARRPPSEDPPGRDDRCRRKILGNIEVGQLRAGWRRLGRAPAGAAQHATVVGVPARVVGATGCADPARFDGPARRGRPVYPPRRRHLIGRRVLDGRACRPAAGMASQPLTARAQAYGPSAAPAPPGRRDSVTKAETAKLQELPASQVRERQHPPDRDEDGPFRRGVHRRGIDRCYRRRQGGRRRFLRLPDGDPRHRPRGRGLRREARRDRLGRARRARACARVKASGGMA